MSSKSSSNFNEFGEALKWLLDERGKSQEWLSDETEIDAGTISKYITGEFNPPRERRIKFFARTIGGEIKEQPNGSWTAKLNKKVKSAVNSVDQLEEKANAYTNEGQSLDEISRDLQLAQRMISSSLEKIDSLKDDI